MTDPESGVLVLAGTPIGDTADASPALLRALEGADVIAAEDTRRLTDLTRRLGTRFSARVVASFDGTKASRVEGLPDPLTAGQRRISRCRGLSQCSNISGPQAGCARFAAINSAAMWSGVRLGDVCGRRLCGCSPATPRSSTRRTSA